MRKPEKNAVTSVTDLSDVGRIERLQHELAEARYAGGGSDGLGKRLAGTLPRGDVDEVETGVPVDEAYELGARVARRANDANAQALGLAVKLRLAVHQCRCLLG